MVEKKIYKKNIVVLITILLLLTVVVIPQTYANVINKKDIENKNGFIKKLFEKIYALFSKIGIDITKIDYSNIQKLGIIEEDYLIIQKCFENYDNNSIKNNIINTKQNLIENIDNLDINNSSSIKSFFKLNETFDLQNIYSRINSLKIGQVKKQLLDMLGNYEPNNINSFEYVYNDTIVDMFKMINETKIYVNPVGYENIYPLVDYVCDIIAHFIMQIAPLLLVLFGVNGVFIAIMVIMIFFAPITLPLSVYVGFCEMCRCGDIWSIIQNDFYNWGLVGVLINCLPLLVECFFMNGFFLIGFGYIFAHILLNSTYDDFGTGECKPVIYADSKKVFHPNTKMMVDVIVHDWDMINNQKFRDYIRIGWTLNNKTGYKIYWSDFVYYNNQHISFDMGFKLDKEWYTTFKSNGNCFYLICQDNWGCFSDWVKVDVKISNDVDKSLGIDSPCFMLYGTLAVLSGLFFVYQNNPSMCIIIGVMIGLVSIVGTCFDCWVEPVIVPKYDG